jgi:hypothetical protein
MLHWADTIFIAFPLFRMLDRSLQNPQIDGKSFSHAILLAKCKHGTMDHGKMHEAISLTHSSVHASLATGHTAASTKL